MMLAEFAQVEGFFHQDISWHHSCRHTISNPINIKGARPKYRVYLLV